MTGGSANTVTVNAPYHAEDSFDLDIGGKISIGSALNISSGLLYVNSVQSAQPARCRTRPWARSRRAQLRSATWRINEGMLTSDTMRRPIRTPAELAADTTFTVGEAANSTASLKIWSCGVVACTTMVIGDKPQSTGTVDVMFVFNDVARCATYALTDPFQPSPTTQKTPDLVVGNAGTGTLKIRSCPLQNPPAGVSPSAYTRLPEVRDLTIGAAAEGKGTIITDSGDWFTVQGNLNTGVGKASTAYVRVNGELIVLGSSSIGAGLNSKSTFEINGGSSVLETEGGASVGNGPGSVASVSTRWLDVGCRQASRRGHLQVAR